MLEVNQRIEVVAVFKAKGETPSIVMPAKMRWGKKEITFTELGLRHPTRQGQRMIHVFDMSDGVNDYRIELDAEALTWTLKSILSGEGR